MSGKPNFVVIKNRVGIRTIAIGAGLIVGAALIVTWLMGGEKQPSPANPSIYMTRYASDPPNCMMCEGWRDPIPSPNGKYILKVRSSHYGQHMFVVLTADYAREVYHAEGPFPTSMSGGGCWTEGWQPDGSLLFTCTTDPSAKKRLDPDAGTVEIVCTGGEPEFSSQGMRWSPDGKRIAMITGSSYSAPTLYVVNKDGSNLIPLARATFDSRLDWSPDGKRIVYTGSSHLIEVIDSDGTHRLELAAGSQPRWSPDGKFIAFIGQDGLYRIDPDGLNLESIIQTDMDSFTWSLDGSRIAFVQTTDLDRYPAKIFTLSTSHQSDQPTLISDKVYVEGEVVWAPDGQQIAFVGRPTRSYERAVYVVGSDGERMTKLTDGLIYEPPIWGADGSSLIFIKHVSTGTHGVIIMNPDDGTEVVLDYDVQYDLDLSSDGVTLAVTRLVDGTQDVYLGNIDGRPLVNLTEMLASQFEHPCR